MLLKIRAPFRCKYILFMVEYEMILYGIQTGRIKEQKMEGICLKKRFFEILGYIEKSEPPA